MLGPRAAFRYGFGPWVRSRWRRFAAGLMRCTAKVGYVCRGPVIDTGLGGPRWPVVGVRVAEPRGRSKGLAEGLPRPRSGRPG